MKYRVMITMGARDQLMGTVFSVPPVLFQQAAVTRAEGRLGVVLHRTDNCYLKPELPHVQQENEDLSLCSGF